jgi:hypothetical protein
MVLVKSEDARKIQIATDFKVKLPSGKPQTISVPLY